MKVKLVEVVKDDCGSWKGTWYKTGDLVYVTINPDYPKIFAEKYRAVDICGGINERDCREVRGLKAWLKCAWKTLTSTRNVRCA